MIRDKNLFSYYSKHKMSGGITTYVTYKGQEVCGFGTFDDLVLKKPEPYIAKRVKDTISMLAHNPIPEYEEKMSAIDAVASGSENVAN